eukprot:TRINITY_DN21378_c0_g1_i1.p1 TRINITY_DN21378_c0_g1~~TRINITY_DN21378_c0_g1_i1.p1  ORF type:complete len:228 (+),score=41.18 TRINITY_DN21378_c0_g1_i1:113-796(+)
MASAWTTPRATTLSHPQQTLGMSKVFILDKYFSELQKFWDTEKRLQDATSTGEAANLQNRLRHLSTELVGLRNRLHGSQVVTTPHMLPPAPMQHHEQPESLTSPQPQYSPPASNNNKDSPHVPYPFGLPMQTSTHPTNNSSSTDGLSTLRSVRNNRNGMTNTGSVSNGPSSNGGPVHGSNNSNMAAVVPPPPMSRPPLQSPKPLGNNLPHHNYSNIQIGRASCRERV